MTKFYIDKDDFLEFIKKAYEEGCCGFMDLRDAVAERIVDEYIEKQKVADEKKMRSQVYPLDNNNYTITGVNEYQIPVTVTNTSNFAIFRDDNQLLQANAQSQELI